jgi:hypothetical protein
MLAYHLWKLNSKLPEKLLMLPPLPKPLLRSPLNQQWSGQRKRKKALADANKERIQQEQVVTEWLNKMLALAGGKYPAFPPLFLLLSCPILCLLMRAFSSIFVSLVV